MNRRPIALALLLAVSGCYDPNASAVQPRPTYESYLKSMPDVLRRAADAGDPGAQTALGSFYERGEEGFPVRKDEALRLYRLAAAQNYPAGLTNLAVFLAEGRETSRDDVEAAHLLSLAARQDFEPAQIYLSAFYLARRGRISDGDPVAIAALKAVVGREMNSRDCRYQHSIVVGAARLYEEGTRGLSRDPAEARRLYEKMAAPPPLGCDSTEARERLAKMPAIPAPDQR